MARLHERVELGGRERQPIQTKSIGGVGFGLGNRLTPWPGLARVRRRRDERTERSVPIDYRSPHPRSVEETSNRASDGRADNSRSFGKQSLQLSVLGQRVAISRHYRSLGHQRNRQYCSHHLQRIFHNLSTSSCIFPLVELFPG